MGTLNPVWLDKNNTLRNKSNIGMTMIQNLYIQNLTVEVNCGYWGKVIRGDYCSGGKFISKNY